MKKIAVSILGALAFTGLASASITPTLDNGFPTAAAGGLFQWTYNIAVDSNESLNPTATAGRTCVGGVSCGTFFTIYDIPGLQGATGGTLSPPNPTNPANWGFSIQLLGVTATQQSTIVDNAALSNVTWTYTGATMAGPLNMDGFTFYSTFNQVNSNGLFSYQATNIKLPGSPDTGQGPVQVPMAPAGVPEPASMALIGGGLVGLALLRRKLVR